MTKFITRFFFLYFLFTLTTIKAQEPLKLEYEVVNPKDVNNAKIRLNVSGGKAPYKYYWAKTDVDTLSSTAENLVEGFDQHVVVKDSNNNSIEKNIEVPTQSVLESFNSGITRVVKNLSHIMFYDVFANFGLYDNTVYAEQLSVAIPHWHANIDDIFTLEKWHIANNQKVHTGDLIATISNKKNEKIEVFAQANGTLKHLEKEGHIIYDSNNKKHVIQEGAHHFASIKYDQLFPIKNPNGTVKKTNMPFVVLWLLVGALFFTFRMGFINIRGFKHALQLASGKYDDPKAPGQVTHFQALTTAVSGTVGLGNIAGVAVAISMGGAGATFWMIVAGLLGMSTKFVECTLGVKYREIKSDGRIFGGPMNYLKLGLAEKKMAVLGKFLAIVFAVTIIFGSFGIGNIFQVNQAYEQLSTQISFLDGNSFYFGLFSAILVGFVIIGGIKSIAKVTEKIVPFMTAFYLIAAFVVIFANIGNIDVAFKAIWSGAFSPSSLKGGLFGVLIIGLQRAVFSNEAGLGSAAIAHSVAKTNHPPSEGFVALLEPFIDTVIICTLTALVLIFTGMHEVQGLAGAKLTSDAFGSVVGWFPKVLAFAIFLFAFSTMITWSYYGMRAWTYIFGKSKNSELIYKIIFLIFVTTGATISLDVVMDLSDMLILAMAFPNILGLYILSGDVRRDLNNYLSDLRNNKLFVKGK